MPAKRSNVATKFFDQKAAMLGKAQEKWLYDGLRSSSSRWNTLAQQVIVAPPPVVRKSI